jgi:2-hydroxychromene-2-carboxylate isomerase
VTAHAEPQPVFFYDLGDVWSYLAAERIMGALPVVPEWEPILAQELGAAATPVLPEEVAARAAELRLLPLRWPSRYPADARLGTLAASYAKGGGRTVAFSLALFRQQFAGGRQLDDEATVLIAAAACEMHPAAVLKGVSLRGTRERLERAHDRARAAGVDQLPAVQIARRVFTGAGCVEQAAAELGAGAR